MQECLCILVYLIAGTSIGYQEEGGLYQRVHSNGLITALRQTSGEQWGQFENAPAARQSGHQDRCKIKRNKTNVGVRRAV